MSQTRGRNVSIIQDLQRGLLQDLENVVTNLFRLKHVNYIYHSLSLISIFPYFMPYFMHLIQVRAQVLWLNVIYIVYNRTMNNCMNNYKQFRWIFSLRKQHGVIIRFWSLPPVLAKNRVL